MTFDLKFPTPNGETLERQLEVGEMLFVLGANGTGKSGLMSRIAKQKDKKTIKISAHRQIWMRTDALEITPSMKTQIEDNIRSEDLGTQSRYRDAYAAQRISKVIYDLIKKDTGIGRRVKTLVENDDINAAKEVAKAEGPIADLNELFRQSNLLITISIEEDDHLMASKNGGPKYGVDKLSDGERNVLLIAGSVLTAPADTLLIIDEPERHLHRSIISPLLSQLFEKRRDCGFIVSTHDHHLPLGVDGARVFLLRSCTCNDQGVWSWDVDELAKDAEIDDDFKHDLLGARRKILFVEGKESSLDKSLYSLIFPTASVIAKDSCRDVERAVRGGGAVERFNWLQVFGIIDGDGYAPEQMQEKRERGIYVLPFYSVEAIYFHPKIIEWIAERQAAVCGEDASDLTKRAEAVGIAAIKNHIGHLSKKVANRLIRKRINEQISNDYDLLRDQSISLETDAENILAQSERELEKAVENHDWKEILAKWPVRESGALSAITKALKFQDKRTYENAVRKLLVENNEAFKFVEGLFGDLSENLKD